MMRGSYSPDRYSTHYQMPKKFPEDIQCVLQSSDPNKGSIYISNVEAAQNPQTLKKLNIKAVLGCAKGYQLSHPPTLLSHYKYVPTEDRQGFDLKPYFEECVNFIKQTIEHTNLLVHCIAGVSRSVSMVLAYLISQKGMTYQQAYNHVKSRRRIIHPNDGFIKQLKTYEQSKKQFIEKKRNFIREYPQQQQYKTKTYLHFDTNQNIDYKTPKKNHIKEQSKSKINQKTYQKNLSKSMKVIDDAKYYRTYQRKNQRASHQNIEKSPYLEAEDNLKTINHPIRKGYFDEMNEELNKKIEAIRQKYQKQRQELLNSKTTNKFRASTSFHDSRGNTENDLKASTRKSIYQPTLFSYKRTQNPIQRNLQYQHYRLKPYYY